MSGLCANCRSALGPPGKKPGARACESCGDQACSKCMRFLDEEAMPYLVDRPPALNKSHYCPACFERDVEPELSQYDETLEQARAVLIFSRPLKVIRRAQAALHVEDCRDKQEAKLKLAFAAVRAGFNALVEFEITGAKVRNHGYQTQRWKAQGVPALVDAARFDRDDGREFS